MTAINNSDSFNCDCNLISLCGCCRTENANSDKEWSCDDENTVPFINNKIFYGGKCLCKSGYNPDCVYKYAGKKVVAIEIKNQRENNIDYDDLAGKIKNSYANAYSSGMILSAFILQISSIKNLSEGKYQLIESCEYGLGKNNITIGKDEKLFIKEECGRWKNINARFYVVKCKDFNDGYFNSILIGI